MSTMRTILAASDFSFDARRAARPAVLLAREHGATLRLIRSGVVLDEILGAADHADMLVLGPRGLRPIHELILGKAAERLLNKSQCPMLVVKQEPASPYRRVLVPVDFGPFADGSALRTIVGAQRRVLPVSRV